MTTSLDGKIALVTGGSRGIGKAIALKLAELGADVAITYSKSREEAEAVVKKLTAHGVKARAFQADAAKQGAMSALADDMLKMFGRVDILVNNAGVFYMGEIGSENETDYARVFDVNVAAVFALTNALVPHMQSGSRIINLSSVLGERASGAGLGVYNASKFAVTGFSRSWAKDLGRKGILVNAVQPGPINTEMNPDNSDMADFMRSQTALGRYGTAQEIAGVVAFLAGPDATYITGATLNVDGGWNA